MFTEDKRSIQTTAYGKAVREMIGYLPEKIRAILLKVELDKLSELEEIRLRAGKPLMVQTYEGDRLLEADGRLSEAVKHLGDFSKAWVTSQLDITKTLELMSGNSIYAFQDEIKNGFITLKGGHRVGIVGHVVMEHGKVKSMKEVSGLNIRISKQITGCAVQLLPFIVERGRIYNTLIVSPPQCGKTTLLRDLARCLSDGSPKDGIQGQKVGIVDERSELASCYKGVPQNAVGMRTDVLDGCPKSIGMVMMIRSMSPKVIITDEIGNKGDMEAVIQVLNAGVKIITSAHGYNISELKSRHEVLEMLNGKVFERLIVLSNRDGPGTVEEIIDGNTLQKLGRGACACC